MLALLLLLQSSSAAVVEGKGSPTAEIPRFEASIRIDGVLDEPVWAQATRLTGFWQYQPVDGRPAEERTEVLVWYSPDAIHFGVIAHDRLPASIRATVADRDNIDNEDQVILDLDTFHDHRRAFFFGVNPFGVQTDGVRSEGAGQVSSLVPGSVDKNPDFLWDSKGRRTERGYEVEIRIPFKSLRYPGGERQTWGFNVTRIVQRTGYTDTWTDVRRANASFLGQEGALGGLHDIRHGVTVEAQPFVTATANGSRDAVSGAFGRADVDPDAGLNLRLGFTSYALDATLNPDFSQVESDEGQVTVNERFALFFPEKRPFFLEGIELFGTPQTLVYTRRIVDPKAGAKFTGKFGQLGVAHLTAVDDGGDGTRDAWFNITRVRRDFGRNSIAGVTFTNRDQGAAHNRVLAGDFRYVWGLYFAQLQYGASWTTSGGATRRAPIFQVEYDRTGRSWGFNYLLRGLGQGFDAQAGFVNRLRSNVVNGHAFNRLTFYGARGALLENLTIFFGPERTWLYDDFGFKEGIEGFEQLDATFQLRGGWELNAHLQRDFVKFQDTSFAGYTVGNGGPSYLPPDDFSGMVWTLGVTTPTWRQLGAELSYTRGRTPLFEEGATGTRRQLTGRVELRPAPTVRIAASGTALQLFRRAGDEFARALIPRLQAEYQPNRALFFRVIGEYRSERRAALRAAKSREPLFIDGTAQPALRSNGLRVDLLASFEPTPGTVAFLGYGSSMETDGDFNWSRLERVSDGFFVKLAYRVRR
ncbi:MAG TPA: DUF5916 domain-containing protein [Gemmatimonadales bacterium]|nr:DUF5916 domain-containing protein [Gemmatimonadales bacterium]